MARSDGDRTHCVRDGGDDDEHLLRLGEDGERQKHLGNFHSKPNCDEVWSFSSRVKPLNFFLKRRG